MNLGRLDWVVPRKCVGPVHWERPRGDEAERRGDAEYQGQLHREGRRDVDDETGVSVGVGVAGLTKR